MPTIDFLVDRLRTYEDNLDSIIAVCKEATAMQKQYGEIKAECIALAQAILADDGVVHHKSESGSCGFSHPKQTKLDKDAWKSVCETNPLLASVQYDTDEA